MPRMGKGQRHLRTPCVTATACIVALAQPVAAQADPQPNPAPELKMARRFPQLAKVSYLVGLPVLGDATSTVGYVRQIVRTKDGRIRLVMSVGGFLGFGSSTVSVPVEYLAMVGKQMAFVDGHYAEIAKTLPKPMPDSTGLNDGEMIRVALTRR